MNNSGIYELYSCLLLTQHTMPQLDTVAVRVPGGRMLRAQGFFSRNMSLLPFPFSDADRLVMTVWSIIWRNI